MGNMGSYGGLCSHSEVKLEDSDCSKYTRSSRHSLVGKGPILYVFPWWRYSISWAEFYVGGTAYLARCGWEQGNWSPLHSLSKRTGMTLPPTTPNWIPPLQKLLMLSWSEMYESNFLWILQDAYRLQLKLFLSEVRQQQLLSSIRSYLKLYSAIPITKLASFMDVDEPTLRWNYSLNMSIIILTILVTLVESYSFYLLIRMALLTYKHKTHVLDYDGRIVSNADVDFYVDKVLSISTLVISHGV